MIRMTHAQYALFRKGKAARKPASKSRVKKRKDELPENIVESQVVGFLRARGWRVDRQHVGTFVPARQALLPPRKRGKWYFVQIGTKGQADWIATRIPMSQKIRGGPTLIPLVSCFEFETKAPGEKRTPEQVAYARRRQLEGGLVITVNDYDTFVEWYTGQYGRGP